MMTQLTSEQLKWVFEQANIAKAKSECSYKQVGAVLARIRGEHLEVVAKGFNHSIDPFRKCTDEFINDGNIIAVNAMLHCNPLNIESYYKDQLFGKKFLRVTMGQFADKHRQFAEVFECHAEMDAVFNLEPGALLDIKNNCDDYFCAVTYEPCLNCCKYLKRLGIHTIYYLNPGLDYKLVYHVPTTLAVIPVNDKDWTVYKEEPYVSK